MSDIVVSIKEFNRRTGDLTKGHVRFNNEVQQLLCIAAQYAFSDDKNVAPATNLVMRGKEFRFPSIDNATLIAWIEKHMPARWDNKECKFRYNKGYAEGTSYDAIALLADPWWKKSRKPTEVASSIDYLEMVRAFVKRMEKEAAVEVDGKKREIKHQSLLLALQNIANAAEYREGV